jgi:putative copper resistance protein D
MIWFGAEIDGPIVATRTVHFAASAMVVGALIFRGFIAEPALRAAPPACALINRQVRGIAWINLPIAVASGLAWVLLLTMSLSGENLGEAVMSGALRDVLSLTQFGWVSQIRFALAIVLAICLVFDRSVLWRWLGLAMAFCLMASMARTGHAASTAHALGYLQRCATSYRRVGLDRWRSIADLLFAAVRRTDTWAPLALDATLRFSILGIVSVVAFMATGAINAWILVGSWQALIVTDWARALGQVRCFRCDARICRGQPILFDVAARGLMLRSCSIGVAWSAHP